jgi:hypothetical protein
MCSTALESTAGSDWAPLWLARVKSFSRFGCGGKYFWESFFAGQILAAQIQIQPCSLADILKSFQHSSATTAKCQQYLLPCRMWILMEVLKLLDFQQQQNKQLALSTARRLMSLPYTLQTRS